MTKKQAHELGDYVRRLRVSRNISARKLAQSVGVDETQILRLERGEVQSPQSTVLGDIASRLDVPMNDLFAIAGYPMSRTLPTIEPYLHAKYPRLTDDEVDLISRIIKKREPHGHDR